MRNIRKPDIGCTECEQIISMVHAHRAEVEIIDFLTRVEFRRLFQRLKCELDVAGLLRNVCQKVERVGIRLLRRERAKDIQRFLEVAHLIKNASPLEVDMRKARIFQASLVKTL